MTPTFVLPTTYLQNLFLVFIRVLAILASSPIFGSRTIHSVAKIGLALLLSFVLLPLGSQNLVSFPGDFFTFALAIGRELLLGFLVGFVASLVFAVLEAAAQLIGVQIGFRIADVMDPVFAIRTSILDQFYTLFASLIFLAIDGHHWLIMGLQRTFAIVPLGGLQISAPAMDTLIGLSAQVFVVALRISLPVAGTLLLTDLALALAARLVPQMNMFLVGMPLKVAVGLVTLLFMLPTANSLIRSLLQGMVGDFILLLEQAK